MWTFEENAGPRPAFTYPISMKRRTDLIIKKQKKRVTVESKKKISKLDPNRWTVANMDYIFGDPEKRTPKQKIAWAERDLKLKETEAFQLKQTSVNEIVNPSKTLPNWRDKYSLPWNDMMYVDPDKRTPEQIFFG